MILSRAKKFRTVLVSVIRRLLPGLPNWCSCELVFASLLIANGCSCRGVCGRMLVRADSADGLERVMLRVGVHPGTAAESDTVASLHGFGSLPAGSWVILPRAGYSGSDAATPPIVSGA